LADDVDCYERARQLGFVRGVLLPVRNALGNAARVGALLEEGPGPYNTGAGGQVGQVDAAMHPNCRLCWDCWGCQLCWQAGSEFGW
jgi:hypothetical protein